MKILVGLLVVAVYAAAVEDDWNEYCRVYGKGYRSSLEAARRRAIWQSNVKFIREHNAKYEKGLVTYEMGANKFADLSFEEFSKLNLGLVPSVIQIDKTEPSIKVNLSATIPSTIDLREQRIVPAVRDQGHCGSCWAFSAIGSIEPLIARTKRIAPPDLSEQELVDCSLGKTSQGERSNFGCSGAYNLNETYNDIRRNGLQLESTYPYTAKDDKCKFSKKKVVYKIGGFKNVQGVRNIIAAVSEKNAVNAGLAVSKGFQLYKSGIYTSTPTEDKSSLNHAIVVIGYNIPQSYLILRNSWGVWGENGYMRLKFEYEKFPLGLGRMASYPTM